MTQNGAAVAVLSTALSSQYNAALDAMLGTIEDVDIVRFDTFAFITDVVDNPTAYGFTNSTQPCYSGFIAPDPTATECDDPDAHVSGRLSIRSLLAEELYTSILHCEAADGEARDVRFDATNYHVFEPLRRERTLTVQTLLSEGAQCQRVPGDATKSATQLQRSAPQVHTIFELQPRARGPARYGASFRFATIPSWPAFNADAWVVLQTRRSKMF